VDLDYMREPVGYHLGRVWVVRAVGDWADRRCARRKTVANPRGSSAHDRLRFDQRGLQMTGSTAFTTDWQAAADDFTRSR